MKRFLVRLSALAGIVVLGLLAIAQAQRSMKDGQKQQAKSDAAAVESDDRSQLANHDDGAARDVGEPHVNHFADESVVRRALDGVSQHRARRISLLICLAPHDALSEHIAWVRRRP